MLATAITAMLAVIRNHFLFDSVILCFQWELHAAFLGSLPTTKALLAYVMVGLSTDKTVVYSSSAMASVVLKHIGVAIAWVLDTWACTNGVLASIVRDWV